ncbi:MAG: glycosyl hydrolase 115 family protein [Butyrivibrio sp.]|uniref:glycosyl hydrolase 115 family protein n=1 Tax=Butyrivibrio sp. TaxID=28121 RepID=UPI0025FB0650|nr:glycosyl hydrolase 115 family protein [Butyrivibrio sp.]MCR5770112.1 glycosyl hydrolase 115 family protein [Butyrivibrio sp.]
MNYKIDNQKSLIFFYPKGTLSGVKKVMNKVSEDVNKVLGITSEFTKVMTYSDIGDSSKDNTDNGTNYIKSIFVGTLGVSTDLPLSSEEEDTLKKRREAYAFLFKKAPGSDEIRLVIIGSDKRGTIYGLFHLSELLGVSPWVNFADVRPAKKEELLMTDEDAFISREPSVKYRGLFINDEWPSFGNWTMKHYGGFTAKMYENVFELILRLKGNYLWPAMWTSNFSLDGPGLLSAELADELGIVMSNSHHEPCSRHSEEWDLVRGEDSKYGNAWNFDKNKEGLTNYWRDGLKRNAPFENIITVGMRGERDSEVLGREATLKENIDYLKEVILTQRNLIKEVYGDNADEVPMMLAIYKEVEKYYFGDETTEGLRSWDGLDGITLMLCEDNQGNMRRLPENGETHNGGFGMYYHFDYHGDPVSYEWVNSTYIPKVCEQMSEAYDKGVRDIWIVNVGDLKPQEFPISYFFELAYDYEKWSVHSEKPYQRFLKYWTAQQFEGFLEDKEQNTVIELLDQYTYLSSIRKPESLYPSTLHSFNYGEADHIYKKVEEIKHKCDELEMYVLGKRLKEIDSALFELVIFPSKIIANHYEMMIAAGKNKACADRGRVIANFYAEEIEKCYRIEKNLISTYHSIESGKWDGMMLSAHTGFRYWNEEENMYPSRSYIWPANKHRMVVTVPLTGEYSMGGDWTRKNLFLYEFIKPLVNTQTFLIENGGNEELEWKIETSEEWISVDLLCGKLPPFEQADEKISEKEITVTIDREKLMSLVKDKASDDAGSADKKSGIIYRNNTYYVAGSLLLTSGNKKVTLVVLAACYKDEDLEKEHLVPVIPDEWLPFISKEDHPSAFEEVRLPVNTGDSIGLAIEAFEYEKLNPDNERELKVISPYGKYSCGLKALGTKDEKDKSHDISYLINTIEEGDYEFTFIIAPSNPVTKDNSLKIAITWDEKQYLLNLIDEKYVGGDNSNYYWSKDIFAGEHRQSLKLHCNKGVGRLDVDLTDDGIVIERILVKHSKSKWHKGFLGPIASDGR